MLIRCRILYYLQYQIRLIIIHDGTGLLKKLKTTVIQAPLIPGRKTGDNNPLHETFLSNSNKVVLLIYEIENG